MNRDHGQLAQLSDSLVDREQIDVSQGLQCQEIKQVRETKELAACLAQIAARTILQGVLEAEGLEGWISVDDLLRLVSLGVSSEVLPLRVLLRLSLLLPQVLERLVYAFFETLTAHRRHFFDDLGHIVPLAFLFL